MGSSKSKSTSKKTTAKKVVTTKAKVTATKAAAPKRAKTVKAAPAQAELVETVETTETVSVEPTAQGALVETTETVRVETANAVEQVEVKSQRVMPWNEVEQLVRQEAFRLAQRRHFRDGTPEQDWFAAEAAVRAQLQARGITLAN